MKTNSTAPATAAPTNAQRAFNAAPTAARAERAATRAREEFELASRLLAAASYELRADSAFAAAEDATKSDRKNAQDTAAAFLRLTESLATAAAVWAAAEAQRANYMKAGAE